jgi:predicted O-linked N-acetylglucosamine transferase (SPINDLY family)
MAFKFLDRFKPRATDPQDHYQRGNAENRLGRWQPALAAYDRAIELDPGFAHAYCNRGAVLERLGRWDDALASYDRALALDSDDVLTHYNRGSVLKQLGRFDEALTSYDRALALQADYPDALVNRGNVLQELGRFDAAIASYDQALRHHQPGFPLYLAHFGRALALLNQRRFEDALSALDRTLELKGDHAEAHFRRGGVLYELERHEAAVASFAAAINCSSGGSPTHLAHFQQSFALVALERQEEALAALSQAIALKPDHFESYINRGNVLLDLKRQQAAIADYDAAIALNPAHALCHMAYSGRGFALKDLQRFAEALASYDQALLRKSDEAVTHLNRGGVLQELHRHEEALSSYDRAIALQPGLGEAFQGRAFSLLSLSRYEAAVASFDQGIALKPDQKHLLSYRRHVQMQICQWEHFDEDLLTLQRGIEADQPVVTPFAALALFDSAPLQRKVAETWMRNGSLPDHALGAIAPRPRHEPLRIGYFSADFRDHPVSLLAAELFETHDRARVEITAFSFGPAPHALDPVRDRVELAFDRFIDVTDQSDLEVAALARELKIDIAVDLGGHTEHSRMKIFALRPAPLQLSYLGYLGTLGVPYMDYLVADATIIPAEARAHYAEKIIYLPSYQVNDSRRRAADHTFTRAELGLPAAGFVFACFNSNYKITPTVFSIWMKILQRVPDSVLYLYAANEIVERNLRKEAERRGVPGHRLVFGKHLQRAEYLARFRSMDLFLDTLPYNAGTTASDALWAGLPVLTCAGDSFAGRVAASLLQAIELPELVTTSANAYEELAVSLATNPALLAGIRQKLAANRLTTRLFDTPRFTRHLEDAYTQIYRRHLENLPPDHIHV